MSINWPLIFMFSSIAFVSTTAVGQNKEVEFLKRQLKEMQKQNRIMEDAYDVLEKENIRLRQSASSTVPVPRKGGSSSVSGKSTANCADCEKRLKDKKKDCKEQAEAAVKALERCNDARTSGDSVAKGVISGQTTIISQLSSHF